MTTTFHFQLMVNKDETTALGMQLREYLVTDFKAMARTGAQWVMQVMTINAGLSNAKQVADHINGGVQVAADDREDSGMASDKISVNFVQMCRCAYQTLLFDDVARKVIDDAEK